MNDELPKDPALQAAVDLLRAPVPLVPGLTLRVNRDRHRVDARTRGIRMLVAAAAVLVLTFAAARLNRPGAAVTFALDAPAVRSVSLVGDFTDWRSDKVRLNRAADGTWHVTLRLQPGRYRFAYVVNDHDWRPDGRAAAVPDDFGRPTSILTVASR